MISGTLYQIHETDEPSDWPSYCHNKTARIFECTKCATHFEIGLDDTTEDTETHKATRCPNCNFKALDVKQVKVGDLIPSRKIEWYDSSD